MAQACDWSSSLVSAPNLANTSMAATAVPYSDSESASDAPCVAPQPEQSTRQRRVVTGVVAAAALMATGAAVTVTRKASSSTQLESALSEATDLSGRMIS